jgi:glutamate-ammonia-ligase adenylyltransferase
VAEEGTLYSVDTELRPHGNAGVLVASDRGFLQYHAESKDLWERQALIKSRPVGPWGHPDRLSRALEDLVYVPRDEAETLRQVQDMKLKIEQAYVPRDPNVLDIKNAPGGIVDIEFVVQAGQLILGHGHPEVRVGSTCPARGL